VRARGESRHVAHPAGVASEPVTIVIADDHAMVRSCLRALLDAHADLSVSPWRAT
jgi:hypothetical protein